MPIPGFAGGPDQHELFDGGATRLASDAREVPSRRDRQFTAALDGDLEPKWTQVWAHINLGKIFDITGQRERAVNEYTQAVRTKDNTQGAQEEAARYLRQPYERKRSPEQ